MRVSAAVQVYAASPPEADLARPKKHDRCHHDTCHAFHMTALTSRAIWLVG
jgi:hypothetical protein